MRSMFMLLVIVTGCAESPDPKLAEISAILAPMQMQKTEDLKARGATPALTTVKHQLRAWVESRLVRLDRADDPAPLARQLNDELKHAALDEATYVERSRGVAVEGDDFNPIGFIGEITLETTGGVLVLRTRMGILCGYDESAYAYDWQDGSWRRIWQSEQPIEPGTPYHPQRIEAVNVSYPIGSSSFIDPNRNRLILTLGYPYWCTSNWSRVYYRLWHVYLDEAKAPLLLDEAQSGYLAHDPAIIGSASQYDVLIAYSTGSLDIDNVHHRDVIRHYRVVDDVVRRIDPIALSPRDFTEEWLDASSEESAAWAASGMSQALQGWHERIRAGDESLRGTYLGPSRRCAGSSDLWQVGIAIGTDTTQDAYFLVRWRPPYDFEMVGISNVPRDDCTVPDEAADHPYVPFPIHGWHH